MTKNIIVHFSGVDVSEFLRKARKIETYGDSVATYDFEFAKNVNGLVTLTNALTVEVWLDSSDPPTTKVFDGYLDTFEPSGGTVTCIAKDKLSLLINNEVNYDYDSSVVGNPANPDGKISDIFIDIVETYGELDTNSGATVVDSGTTVVLKKFTCINADPFERCRKLADTLNWVFYYRADTDYVYFEPKNYVLNANTLSVDTNILTIPEWEYDKSEMINSLTVEGLQQLVQTSEVFTGDASETDFVLSFIPIDLVVYYGAAINFVTTAPLQSQVMSIDVVGGTTTHDVEVDKKLQTIYFTGFTPAASANNIIVTYSYFAPYPVKSSDAGSIATYGTFKKTMPLTDVLSIDDARARGQNILSKYSEPFKSAKLKVLWSNTLSVRVGQQVQVVDNINVPNINQAFTVFKTVDYWPESFVELEVGDKQYSIQEYQSNVLERVKRLEETVIGSTGFVSQDINTYLTLPLAPYQTVFLTQYINDSFILDHDVNGVLYDADETAILSDFEDHTDWSNTGLTQTLADDSTAGHFWVSTQGVKSTWTDATGTGSITDTITTVDLSAVTGVASGTPSSGTAGLWMYCTNGSLISETRLRLGSDSSNYKEYIATTYSGSALANDRNYLLFDLDSPDDTTGTVDWTDITYLFIEWDVTGATNATFDYLTVSLSDDIGLNGLGERATTLSSTTHTW